MLPPKVVQLSTVEMSGEMAEAYKTIFDSAQGAVRALLAAAAGRGGDPFEGTFSSILECILRLRMCCDCSTLIPRERLANAAAVLRQLDAQGAVEGAAPKKLTAEDAAKLLKALQGALNDQDTSDCCICLEMLSEDKTRVLSRCRHVMCDTCIDALLATQNFLCPLCRQPFSRIDVLDPASVKEVVGDGDGDGDRDGDQDGGGNEDGAAAAPRQSLSPKIAALLQDLAAMKAESPQLKAVIFTQFTSFLTLVAENLQHEGWPCSRLQGSFSAKKRASEISRWRVANDLGGNSLLIVSTRAGGQGLNLTEGSRVFMLDPLWNAAQEEQAMDRCHRLGQTKKVHVVRYVMKDSIEEKMLKLQAKKAALNTGALAKLSNEEIRDSRLAEMVMLFDL